MTTWHGGDVITSSWMNSVEQILAMGTFAAVADPRLTMAPNDNFDVSAAVASNLRLNGSISVAASKYFEFIGVRTLTSTIASGGVSYAAVLTWDHSATFTGGSSCAAYGLVGSVTGTSGAGKINGLYSRIISSGVNYTGVGVAGIFAASSVAGTVWGGTSDLLDLVHDSTDLTVTFPFGVQMYSNTAGAKLGYGVSVGTTLNVTNSCFVQTQCSGSTGAYQQLFNSSSVKLWEIDYLGNMNFKASGPAAGQLITGDMDNASYEKRMAFKTATTDAATSLEVIPNGTGTSSALVLWSGSDRSAAANDFLALTSSTAGGIINCENSLTMTVETTLSLTTGGCEVLASSAVGDARVGLIPGATTDTEGFMYIPSIDGPPTGVPANIYVSAGIGHVPMRYDATNNRIYVYNGGWVKTATLT